MDRNYLTTVQLAARYQLSKRYLEEQRHRGTGPAYIAFGKAIRYPLAAAEEWAARHLVKTGVA